MSNLVNRIRSLLCYVGRNEAIRILVEEGNDPTDLFFAFAAAKALDRLEG